MKNKKILAQASKETNAQKLEKTAKHHIIQEMKAINTKENHPHCSERKEKEK